LLNSFIIYVNLGYNTEMRYGNNNKDKYRFA